MGFFSKQMTQDMYSQFEEEMLSSENNIEDINLDSFVAMESVDFENKGYKLFTKDFTC